MSKTVHILCRCPEIANLFLKHLFTINLATLICAVTVVACGCHKAPLKTASAEEATLEYYSYDFLPRHRDPDDTNTVWVTVVELRPKDFTQTGKIEPGIRIQCNQPSDVLNAIAPYHWKLVAQSGSNYTVARPRQFEYKFSILMELAQPDK